MSAVHKINSPSRNEAEEVCTRSRRHVDERVDEPAWARVTRAEVLEANKLQNMLGGASQIVSRIRTQCNGT